MRLVYPLLWSRLGRQADREQSVKTAAAFARRGIEVTLLMPQGPRDPALSAGALRDWFEVEGEFELVQRRTPWRGEGAIPSALWYLEVARLGLVKASDILYSRMPAAFGGGYHSPVPFAVEHYQPWPDRLPVLRPMIRRTARAAHCLGFVLHSAYAAASFRRIGVPEARLLVAHNGADLAGQRLGREAARARLGLPAGAAIAVYAGRVSARKGLERVLEMAAARPATLFLLVGSEGEGPVEAAAARLGNVRVVPWQEPGRLPQWLDSADVLIVPPSSAPLERYGDCVLPMKTFAYLAAGRPILAPASPDTAELLRDGENALLVPPDDPAAAAAGLDRLLGDRALAARLAAGARRTAAGLGWDDRAARIAAFLKGGR
ncbi:MAG: glycosyltransferase [Alphaproteobacteria bacterium]|nr:glycosyltransferase [Alphaproteobacteria bacterium]MBV9370139.1 glycosyltransferase [Alphaproteobacteria bacterium]MBV9901479.1 glycosyltransferase [Alphaproteobacteria bacterium]